MTLQILDVILCQMIPGFDSTCLSPCTQVCNASENPLELGLQYLKAQPPRKRRYASLLGSAPDDARVESHGFATPI